MQRPLWIVSTGQTFEHLRTALGDFDDWMAAGLRAGAPDVPLQRWDARSGLPPEAPHALAGVVLTGSHAMVSDAEPWSEALAGWLRACVQAQLPVLGICYGHQLLAHALGGQVGYHPQGWEVGTHQVQCAPDVVHDPLWCAMPAAFDAHLVHAQSVLQLPAQAVCLARTAHEPHQAFRVGACAWGVQFHPEFSTAAMHGYIEAVQPQLLQQGQQPEALLAGVRPTPHAAALLARFAALVAQRTAAVAAAPAPA